jgi:hypothetical protein
LEFQRRAKNVNEALCEKRKLLVNFWKLYMVPTKLVFFRFSKIPIFIVIISITVKYIGFLSHHTQKTVAVERDVPERSILLEVSVHLLCLHVPDRLFPVYVHNVFRYL